MLDQRQRRWADIVQMLYKCCVYWDVGLIQSNIGSTSCVFWGSIRLTVSAKDINISVYLFFFIQTNQADHAKN